MQIHERIKAERIKRNFTEEQMAEKLEITRSTYQYWEKKTPSTDKIMRVAVVLGLPNDYFFITEGENTRGKINHAGDRNDEKLQTLLELGDIKVTVADYINLLNEMKILQGDVIKSLLQEKESNSKKMDFYADEVLKNMRADHETILSALDRVLALPPGTLGKESDTRMPGALPVKKGTHSQKGVFDKKGKD